jgi:hypothetical protein
MGKACRLRGSCKPPRPTRAAAIGLQHGLDRTATGPKQGQAQICGSQFRKPPGERRRLKAAWATGGVRAIDHFVVLWPRWGEGQEGDSQLYRQY